MNLRVPAPVPSDPGRQADEPTGRARPAVRTLIAEAIVGLVIALILLWVAVAAVTDVPFVYQGL